MVEERYIFRVTKARVFTVSACSNVRNYLGCCLRNDRELQRENRLTCLEKYLLGKWVTPSLALGVVLEKGLVNKNDALVLGGRVASSICGFYNYIETGVLSGVNMNFVIALNYTRSRKPQ